MRYYALRRDFPRKEDRKRVVGNLKALREDLKEKIPAKAYGENVLIATWNIRDFDSNKFGHGPRLSESFYYLGELLSSFDLIAIQEVNEDLSAFQRLIYLMGDQWDYITTDAVEGSSGNKERMTFLYDKQRVSFEKIAGEIVLSKKRLLPGALQFARTPFLVAFRSGWFTFKMCTVHIYYGSDRGEKLLRRIAEIDSIARHLAKRAKKKEENLILLGDFNITSPEHQTMKALEQNGFKIPEALKKSPTNMFQTKHYDQIAFKEKENEVQLAEKPNSAGAYNYYQKVFTARQYPQYEKVIKSSLNKRIEKKREALKKTRSSSKKASLQKEIKNLQQIKSSEENLKTYYKNIWRSFQMSDHLPMWVELKINFSTKYLDNL